MRLIFDGATSSSRSASSNGSLVEFNKLIAQRKKGESVALLVRGGEGAMLERTARRETGEAPETYPLGV